MKQFEHEISNIIKNALHKFSPSMSFEALWDMNSYKSQFKSKYRRAALVPLTVILTLLACFTIGYAGFSRLTDNTDLPFVDDPSVIGKWETIDFVDDIEDFNPEKHITDTEPYLNNLVFIKNGKMLNGIDNSNLSYSGSTWTKGVIIDKAERTAEKYEIKEFNGSKYMFMEWKSGDYIFRLMKPKFYVLKQLDTEDYSNYEVQKIEDKIDYPFVNNPEMIGRWVSVDLVEEIDDFNPKKIRYLDDRSLKELKLSKHGKVTSKNLYGDVLDPTLSWTENLIISQRNITASKCEIKQINDETYMFLEWKSGDYIHRGMKPQYYVLKKVE